MNNKRRGAPVLRASLLALATASLTAWSAPAGAETISGALTKAYGYSPDLDQQRAGTRAADENVPRALSALRPTVSATGSTGISANRIESGNSSGNIASHTTTRPSTLGLTATQTIYNGNRTLNSIRQAESGVLQSREQLRANEQNILQNAATAYMNVLRDTALLNLNNNNIQVLQEQLKITRDRFNVGEVTRTDVAQAEAALALGQANAFTAQSNLQNSLAVYRQLIGDQPHDLQPARPVEALLPRSLNDAVALSQSEHPLIETALHAVDVAALNVKVQEGALLPTVSAQAGISQSFDSQFTPGSQIFSAQALGNITIPIYDGGLTYANIRQAKEQLGQLRLQADQQREAVRAAVVSSWGAYLNTKASIQSFQSQVRASEIALNGIREEAKVGQRTTFDVLTAQQTLLSARTNLIGAQRDQVVNSYVLLAAVGQLSAQSLGLGVVLYDPTIHYDQIKNKAFGGSTPDGR